MPKKRSPGLGGLYKLKGRNLWRGTLELGYDADGKRVTKTVHGKTQTIARDKLDALKKEVEQYGAPLDRATTLAAWGDEWLRTVGKPTLKPNTYTAYSSLNRRWIAPTIGRKQVANLKPSDVRAVIDTMRSNGKATSSMRQCHRVLSLMLDAAKDEGLIGTNPAAVVRPPGKKDKGAVVAKRNAFTFDQARTILTTASETERARWGVAFLAGLRQSEALGLRWDDLDLDAGMLHLAWSLDEIPREHGCGEDPQHPTCGQKLTTRCPQARWRIPDDFQMHQLEGRWCLISPKADEPRPVPLIPQLATELRRWQEASADLPNPHGLVWPGEGGSPRMPRDDGQAFRDLLHKAGIIPAEQVPANKGAPGTHWARHTTVTLLTELGYDAVVIGEIVGHGSVQVTRDYQHVSSPMVRQAAEDLGKRLALPW